MKKRIWLLPLLLLFSFFSPNISEAGLFSRKPREPELKVKIGTGRYKEITIGFPSGGMVYSAKGTRLKSLRTGGAFSWSNTPDKKRKRISYLNETHTFKANNGILTFNKKEYRGKLVVKFTADGAVVVNEIGIEDYLRGVVGSEIGASSPPESLKAQAVIARTYAYANKNRHGSDGADICNTTHCQVYSGKSAERDSTDKAIKATKGQILVSNGEPISALYHATCGGMTSDNDLVFGGAPRAFLRRVRCNFCSEGSKYRWNQEIDIPELRAALAKEGIKIDEAYGLSIEAPAKMDRVTNLVFKNKNGVAQKVKGTTVRRLCNLPTTTFIIESLDATNDLATANTTASQSKVIYKQVPGCVISTFSNTQDSPKQLLVYCGGGLVRSIMPKEGWQCISYKENAKTIAVDASNVDNKKSNNKKVTSPKTKVLKPIKKAKLMGRGYGHQVGLCQSGAVGMGKKGWNYKQILAHYYQKVTLRKLGY